MMAMLRILSMSAPLGEESAQYACAQRRRQTPPSRCETVGLAHDVVAVDPGAMVVVPRPMSRHPDVIHSACPITRTMEVVRPIANFDVDCNGRRSRAHAQ